MRKKSRITKVCDWTLNQISSLLGAKTQFGTRSYTRRCEQVRSRAENKVANYLTSKGIKYIYERKMIINGNPVMPDFFLPEFNTIIEYFGLQGKKDKRKRDYEKTEIYQKSNYNFIPLYKEDLDRLDYVILPRLPTTA